MILGKKVLAIIPARGGSKGLPGKNLRPLVGRPLIQWSIDLANDCEFIDRVVVSTDDEEIAQVAREAGAQVPFLRPAALACDSSPTKDALLHCLRTLELGGQSPTGEYVEKEQFDLLVLLQPTSPLRTKATTEACIQLSATSGKTVITVSESRKPVEWMFYRHDEGFQYVLEGIHTPTRRQDCRPVYYVDGCVYCMPVDGFGDGPDIFNEHALTVVSQPDEAVDIDTIDDFRYCEFLLKGDH